MIRRAAPDDVPLIVELAAEAHQGSVWEAVGACPKPESIATTARHLMSREDAAVLVCDRGVFMGSRVPLWFDLDESIAHEIFFYATRGGDALRREAERWAGPGLGTLSRHQTTDPRLESLYRRAGYVPIEHTFIRRA